MANQTCPGCGAPYNGKKCRFCFYAPMDTDVSSRPTADHPKRNFSRKQRQQKTAMGSFAGFLVILVALSAVLPGFRNFGLKLDAIDAANRTPEPIPGNPTVLFQQEPITVLVPGQNDSDISLWFYNQGKEDVLVICRDITVNGQQMTGAQVLVALPGGNAIKSSLLDQNADAKEVSFVLEGQKMNGEFLFETAPIQLDIG